MYNFNLLLFEATNIYTLEEIEDYLESFFTTTKLANYVMDELASDEDKEAIYEMFTGQGDVLSRAIRVIETNPFCLEANLVYYRLNDETISYAHFTDIYAKGNLYDTFTPYQKKAFIQILRLYGEYLTNIFNRSQAVKIINEAARFDGKYTSDDIINLAFLYNEKEDATNFYNLYLQEDFDNIEVYLLLLVVLLKNDEELKAKEVFNDLLARNKYVEYIDHIWDISEDYSEESIEFQKAVNNCFEQLTTVPNFFSWCADNKEEKYLS